MASHVDYSITEDVDRSKIGASTRRARFQAFPFIPIFTNVHRISFLQKKTRMILNIWKIILCARIPFFAKFLRLLKC